MAINFAEIQQKLDRVLSNAGEIVRNLWKLHFDPNPQDVLTEIYDENGNLRQVSIPNLAKWRDTVWRDAQSAMSKTFYVDQVNGSDTTGDGSQVSPFQTIDKAISSVPSGGSVEINVLGDYIVDSDINTRRRNVYLILRGALRFTVRTTTVDSGTYAYINGFIINDSLLRILIESNYNGKIIIEPNNTGITNFTPFGKAAFKTASYGSLSSLKIDIFTRVDNYHPIEIHSGYLFSFFHWDYLRFRTDISISGHYRGRNRGIVIASTALGLINLPDGAPASIHLYYDGGWQNERGYGIKPKIAGIVRDANGVPRNVISNLVL